MASPNATRGFTLLEVLVALIIFALAFGAIASIFQTALRQAATASSKMDALALAEQQLARFGVEIPIAPGERQGRIETSNGSPLFWRSRIDLAEPVDDGVSIALYHIILDISDGETGPPHLTLQTFKIGLAP
jgi:general secretion pathway protein I